MSSVLIYVIRNVGNFHGLGDRETMSMKDRTWFGTHGHKQSPRWTPCPMQAF